MTNVLNGFGPLQFTKIFLGCYGNKLFPFNVGKYDFLQKEVAVLIGYACYGKEK